MADTTAWGVIVMLPGLLAALTNYKPLKYCGLAVSLLMAIAAIFGLFRWH